MHPPPPLLPPRPWITAVIYTHSVAPPLANPTAMSSSARPKSQPHREPASCDPFPPPCPLLHVPNPNPIVNPVPPSAPRFDGHTSPTSGLVPSFAPIPLPHDTPPNLCLLHPMLPRRPDWPLVIRWVVYSNGPGVLDHHPPIHHPTTTTQITTHQIMPDNHQQTKFLHCPKMKGKTCFPSNSRTGKRTIVWPLATRLGRAVINNLTQNLGAVTFPEDNKPAGRGSQAMVATGSRQLVLELRTQVHDAQQIADDDIVVIMADGGVWRAIIVDTVSQPC
ncbi:hypothetical protein BKA70DRAFT_1445216 [Coprinopsis sp. MPI-PUGE-AT-0042]|nr:hypothetical protein BKA70DRAFT_1445216 [Coprinopsis sp. MPI-PUGE-AT-0042]